MKLIFDYKFIISIKNWWKKHVNAKFLLIACGKQSILTNFFSRKKSFSQRSRLGRFFCGKKLIISDFFSLGYNRKYCIYMFFHQFFMLIMNFLPKIYFIHSNYFILQFFRFFHHSRAFSCGSIIFIHYK